MTDRRVDYLQAFNEWVDAADRGPYFEFVEDEIWRWVESGAPKEPEAEYNDDEDAYTYWVGRYGIVYKFFVKPDLCEWVVVIDIV